MTFETTEPKLEEQIDYIAKRHWQFNLANVEHEDGTTKYEASIWTQRTHNFPVRRYADTPSEALFLCIVDAS